MSKQCTAKTLAGKRCKNRVNNKQVCFQHTSQAVRISSKPSRERLALTVGIVGGSTAILEQIIKVVSYVSAHWDGITEITKYLRDMRIGHMHDADDDIPIPFYPPPSVRKRPYRPRSLREHCMYLLLEKKTVPNEELKAVSKKFDTWFNQLPRQVQKGVVKRFGTKKLQAMKGF